MKYIDSEKLIAEIERRIEETKSMKPTFDQFWAGQISAFKGALKIVKSLQQEQPEVDSEKEIKNYLATKCAGDDEPSVSEIARHFWDKGYNAGKEEMK